MQAHRAALQACRAAIFLYPMKNIHGGPAVNPCTQGPEFGATPLAMSARSERWHSAAAGCLSVFPAVQHE